MTGRCKGQLDSIHIRSIQWDSSWPELAEDSERDFVFSYMWERFGIPEDEFNPYLLFKKKNRSYWMIRKSSHLIGASRLKIRIMGMKAFQEIGDYVKPTTRFIQIFGRFAKTAIFEVDEKCLQNLLAGREVPKDMGIDNGYVILKFKKSLLGLGLLINGFVRSQIPLKEIPIPQKPFLDKSDAIF